MMLYDYRKFRTIMLLDCFILYCFISLYNVDGAKLPRYVIESGMKPAIFGSYSYDVVKGIFVLPSNSTTTMEASLNDLIFNNSSSTVGDKNLRKHVAVTETHKAIDWWTHARLFLKNSTRNFKTNVNKIKP